MCGIAGWVLNPGDEKFPLSKIAAILATEIESRGRDATGICTVSKKGRIKVRKSPDKASVFLKRHAGIGDWARLALIHTRAATQGSPSVNGNNHPIVSGDTIGIHNGMIYNDDALWKKNVLAKRRHEVDSEVIFALLDSYRGVTNTLECIDGWMAIAWINQQAPTILNLARGSSSPLEIGVTEKGSLFFASTQAALKKIDDIVGGLKMTTLREGDIIEYDGYPENLQVTTFKPLDADAQWNRYTRHQSAWARTQGDTTTPKVSVTRYGSYSSGEFDDHVSAHGVTWEEFDYIEQDWPLKIGDSVRHEVHEWTGEVVGFGAKTGYFVQWDPTSMDRGDIRPVGMARLRCIEEFLNDEDAAADWVPDRDDVISIDNELIDPFDGSQLSLETGDAADRRTNFVGWGRDSTTKGD